MEELELKCPFCKVNHGIDLFSDSRNDDFKLKTTELIPSQKGATYKGLRNRFEQEQIFKEDVEKHEEPVLYMENKGQVEVVEYIARGSYGYVFKGWLKYPDDLLKNKQPPQEVAIKIYQHNVDKFHKEVFALSRIHPHPNIVDYCGFGFTADGSPFLVTSYGGFSITSFLDDSDEVPETNAKRIRTEESKSNQQIKPKKEDLGSTKTMIYGILSALEHCHKVYGISHCDLKLDNVLYHHQQHRVSIADWNSASGIEKVHMDLKALGRIALRILKDQPHGNMPDKVLKNLLLDLDSPWKEIIEELLGLSKIRIPREKIYEWIFERLK